jgi:hypothetical protein
VTTYHLEHVNCITTITLLLVCTPNVIITLFGLHSECDRSWIEPKIPCNAHTARKILRVFPEPPGNDVHPVPLIKLDGDTKEHDVVLRVSPRVY